MTTEPNAETVILGFLKEHFPTVLQKDHINEKQMVRFLSYVLRYASRHIKKTEYQATVSAVYGMLQLYGLSGTVIIAAKVIQPLVAQQMKQVNHVGAPKPPATSGM